MNDLEELNRLTRPHLVTGLDGAPKIFALHMTEPPTMAQVRSIEATWKASGALEHGHKLMLIGPEWRLEELADGRLAELGLVRAVAAHPLQVTHRSGETHVHRLVQGKTADEEAQVIDLPDSASAVIRCARAPAASDRR